MQVTRFALGVLLALFVARDAISQINSPGARTLFARNFLYRSDMRFLGEDAHVWENAFVYGVAPKWMAVAVVPVESDGGVGPPTFFVQYDGLFHRNRPGGFTRLAAFVGASKDRLIPGLVFTHATSRWFWNADFQWTARDELGDVIHADASAMYRLFRYPESSDLFLVLELNGAREREAERTALYLSPGVEWFVRPNVALELSVQMPLQRERERVWVTGVRIIR